jgi:hypothetical protein
MGARQLIEGANFNAQTVTAMGKAFDQTWSEIADTFAGDEELIDRTRMHLAHAILLVADQDCRNVERLKNEALQILALTFSDPPPKNTFVQKRVHAA